MILENPFENDKKKNYILLSSGTGDDIIRMSNTNSNVNSGGMIIFLYSI